LFNDIGTNLMRLRQARNLYFNPKSGIDCTSFDAEITLLNNPQRDELSDDDIDADCFQDLEIGKKHNNGAYADLHNILTKKCEQHLTLYSSSCRCEYCVLQFFTLRKMEKVEEETTSEEHHAFLDLDSSIKDTSTKKTFCFSVCKLLLLCCQYNK